MVVAIGSAVSGFLSLRYSNASVGVMVLVLIPSFLSVGLYWLPIAMGHSDSSELGAWSGLFITLWCVVGLMASILAFAVGYYRIKRAEQYVIGW